MKVILKEDIENLGKKGDIVNVADGYARNYLIPCGFALAVTRGNVRLIEEEKKRLLRQREKEIKTAEELAEKLNNLELEIYKKAGENDVLYGSVTTSELAELLEKEGIQIDKKAILLEEPIKRLGVHYFEVRVHNEIKARVRVVVKKEEEEV
ncbi:MAG: 50S ribosomal protein L9 [Candidatus Aminicenantes bacterium]|nr:50S ribosomal protein L9 [Candidatus Aminicenantes bacterium]